MWLPTFFMQVDDIHEDHKPRHTLNKSRVVSLPLMRTNPETDPEALYPKGALGKFCLIATISYSFTINHIFSLSV